MIPLPLQQFAKDFTAIDSLTFEVENQIKFVQQAETVMLETIAKDSNEDYYCSDGSHVTCSYLQLPTATYCYLLQLLIVTCSQTAHA